MGVLVVIEGGEGAGKTTLIRGLENALDETGIQFVSTREPGGTEWGKQIRGILLDPTMTLSPLAELMLFAADRADHVAAVIRPALDDGLLVLCDRFSGSTVAYQGYGRGMPVEQIQQLDRMARNGLTPHLTLWLDVDPAVGLSRTKGRDPDRMEASGQAFHRRVYEGFLTQYLSHKGSSDKAWDPRPGDWVRIDASSPPADVLRQAFSWITETYRAFQVEPIAAPQRRYCGKPFPG